MNYLCCSQRELSLEKKERNSELLYCIPEADSVNSTSNAV